MQFAFHKALYGARRRTLALTISACCLLTVSACTDTAAPNTSRTATPTGPTAPRTAFPMPPVTTTQGRADASLHSFTLLDNRRMRVSDYLGDVLVLDFWATYCPPCLEEAPHLVALQKRYGTQGLRIIGLNVGGPDDRDKIPAFVERFNIQYTLGFPDPQMSDLYLSGDTSIPQTIVIDRQGNIVKHFVGYDSTVSAELERAIEKAVTSDE